LVGGVIGRGGGDDDGELQRAGGLKGGNGANDVGALLADRDVDGINRAELGVAAGETDFVDLRLIDDRVDRDGGLARAAVTDDEFALATTDRDHGVDRHDTGEERLVDRLAGHNAGSDTLDGIGFLESIGPLPSTGLPSASTTRPRRALPTGTERSLPVVVTSSPSLSLETSPRITQPTSLSSRLRAMPMAPPGNCDHLVIHHVGEAVDFGDAVGDGADVAGVLLDRFASESLAICCSIWSRTVLISGKGVKGWTRSGF